MFHRADEAGHSARLQASSGRTDSELVRCSNGRVLVHRELRGHCAPPGGETASVTEFWGMGSFCGQAQVDDGRSLRTH
jgi:hypothetical protein